MSKRVVQHAWRANVMTEERRPGRGADRRKREEHVDENDDDVDIMMVIVVANKSEGQESQYTENVCEVTLVGLVPSLFSCPWFSCNGVCS